MNNKTDDDQNSRFRRSFKNLIVDSGMQSRLGLNFVLVNFCVSGIGIFIILQKVNSLREAINGVPGLVLDSNSDFTTALVNLISSCFLLIICTIFINFIFGLYMAHRFAGPMKVITDYIDEMIAGQFTPGRNLRPRDELKPIMAKLSVLAERLKKGEK